MSVVELRGVVAVLGRFPALAGLDLTVAVGETVLVQGPNGGGKSTLLRLCAGLVVPTRGEARVLGFDLVVERHAVRRRVGLLGHATGLYDDLTVAENVIFWARAAGLGLAAEARANWALGRLGWTAHWPTKRCAPYRPGSGGERRWPRSPYGVRTCGYWTNHTPASTRRVGTSSTT